MICYKDKTFCSKADKCATEPCDRRFTEEDAIQAKLWWGGSEGCLVAYTDLSKECGMYEPIKDEKYD